MLGRVPPGVTLPPVDFEADDLGDRLDGEWYDPEARIFFIGEAVTQYLTESGVRQTLDHLADAAQGIRLAFTFVRRDFLDGTSMYGVQATPQDFAVKRGLWRFGLHPDQVAAFLAEYGWRKHEQVGPAKYDIGYLQPAGRNMTASEIERTVFAER